MPPVDIPHQIDHALDLATNRSVPVGSILNNPRKLTTEVILSYINCKYKAYLMLSGTFQALGPYEEWFRVQDEEYRSRCIRAINDRTNNSLLSYGTKNGDTYQIGTAIVEVGGYLGCKWSDGDAAIGANAIVWRAQWERFGDAALKDRLLRYNEEDCHALNALTSFLCCVPTTVEGVKRNESAIQFVEQIKTDAIDRKFGQADYSVKDFGTITERAYFDYQRSKIYIRTNDHFITFARRKKKHERSSPIRPNKIVKLRAVVCSNCKSNNIARDHRNFDVRETLDLRISPGGIRRWVVRHRAAFHKCDDCGKEFIPKTLKSKPRYGHSLISWAIDQHISNRVTFQNIERTAKAHFGLSIRYTKVHQFKSVFVNYYKRTYRGILNNLVEGRIIHADETTINLQKERGYVWVLTSMEDVYYFYRSGREASFLHEMLDGFRGTLISDFYSGYDSLPCPQQKCLIHLIRDINDDLLKNPFDRELKALATSFGVLLRAIIEKIDRVGLRASELVKYKPEVDLFIGLISLRNCESEVADKYVKRILKYRHQLFTFLEYDDVPWNNSNAEHAIKRFAKYRSLVNGRMSRSGLEDYLVLLSIHETCRYKEIKFLDFLLSKMKDIDRFIQTW